MDKSSIMNSNPEVLAQYSLDLKKFVNNVSQSIVDLNNYYMRIANSWQGPQYEQFGESVNEVRAAVCSELEQLLTLADFVGRKALELAEAQGVKF